jgi:UTP--glucose-1-phosphate uridylyltransferase
VVGGGRVVDPLRDPRFDTRLLRDYDFDPEQFAVDVAHVRRDPALHTRSFLAGRLSPVSDVTTLHFDERSDERDLARLGHVALSGGKVAALVLNGGLATRFGCVVKGVVTVFDEQSFLALKLSDIRRASTLYGRPIPTVLLNSFATALDTRAHLDAHDRFGLPPDELLGLAQSVSVRLDGQGEPFFGQDGQPRYYAPGHGEFFERLRRSPILGQLRARGIHYLLFSNGDNLGATVDPVIVGHHVASGVDVTIEVTEKRRSPDGQWDVGGSPVCVDGAAQVVEWFRFPPGFDQDSLPDLQTNNMVFSLDALVEPIAMQRYLVEKSIDGRPALAFESITCEASSVCRADGTPRLSLGLVRVPRDGKVGRFFPVKSREDLDRVRARLRERLEVGWLRRERGFEAG